MAKPIVDMYGNVLHVGDLIMITSKAVSKESRPNIVFEHVQGFYKGMITIEKRTHPYGAYNMDVNIRPKSSEIRKVSGDFAEAWRSGELFKML